MNIPDVTVEQAWTTFHMPLHELQQRHVADETSAEDIVQDVFLKVHMHIDTLSDTSKLQSGLYHLARNAVIDHYRRTRVMVGCDNDSLPQQLWVIISSSGSMFVAE